MFLANSTRNQVNKCYMYIFDSILIDRISDASSVQFTRRKKKCSREVLEPMERGGNFEIINNATYNNNNNNKHILGSYQSVQTVISGYKTYCTAAFIGEPNGTTFWPGSTCGEMGLGCLLQRTQCTMTLFGRESYNVNTGAICFSLHCLPISRSGVQNTEGWEE